MGVLASFGPSAPPADFLERERTWSHLDQRCSPNLIGFGRKGAWGRVVAVMTAAPVGEEAESCRTLVSPKDPPVWIVGR